MTRQPTLKRNFVASAVAAALAAIILVIAGEAIRSAGATSYLSLEFTASAQTMRDIVASWSKYDVAWVGAFAMWFDYLFMLAYAALFILSARICVAAKWTVSARLRNLLVALPSVAIVTALLDALENALEMLVGYSLAPIPDVLAPIALAVTIVKWTGVAICFPAVPAAFWALATRRY